MAESLLSSYLGYGDSEGLSDEDFACFAEEREELIQEGFERMERDHENGKYEEDTF